MNIVFYGPEGSGKGTQASLLAKELKIPHLVSGDLVRKYAGEDKGIMGEVCREALFKGRLRRYNAGQKAVLRYYEKRGLLVHIDGQRPVAAVHLDIMRKLEARGKQK